jgi:hypothetical protein
MCAHQVGSTAHVRVVLRGSVSRRRRHASGDSALLSTAPCEVSLVEQSDIRQPAIAGAYDVLLHVCVMRFTLHV